MSLGSIPTRACGSSVVRIRHLSGLVGWGVLLPLWCLTTTVLQSCCHPCFCWIRLLHLLLVMYLHLPPTWPGGGGRGGTGNASTATLGRSEHAALNNRWLSVAGGCGRMLPPFLTELLTFGMRGGWVASCCFARSSPSAW